VYAFGKGDSFPSSLVRSINRVSAEAGLVIIGVCVERVIGFIRAAENGHPAALLHIACLDYRWIGEEERGTPSCSPACQTR
jgi:hypothetical protein